MLLLLPTERRSTYHVYCHCRLLEEFDHKMVECTRCKSWYHVTCVGPHQKVVPVHWKCDECCNNSSNLLKIVCHVNLILVLVCFVAWNQNFLKSVCCIKARLSYMNVWSYTCKVQVGFKGHKVCETAQLLHQMQTQSVHTIDARQLKCPIINDFRQCPLSLPY